MIKKIIDKEKYTDSISLEEYSYDSDSVLIFDKSGSYVEYNRKNLITWFNVEDYRLVDQKTNQYMFKLPIFNKLINHESVCLLCGENNYFKLLQKGEDYKIKAVNKDGIQIIGKKNKDILPKFHIVDEKQEYLKKKEQELQSEEKAKEVQKRELVLNKYNNVFRPLLLSCLNIPEQIQLDIISGNLEEEITSGDIVLAENKLNKYINSISDFYTDTNIEIQIIEIENKSNEKLNLVNGDEKLLQILDRAICSGYDKFKTAKVLNSLKKRFTDYDLIENSLILEYIN